MNRRLIAIIAAAIVLIGLLVGLYILISNATPDLTVGTFENPFGTAAGDRSPTDTTYTGPVQGAGIVAAPKLLKLTDGPVAKGARALVIPATPATGTSTDAVPAKEADTEVRYIERASGNIYAFRIHDRVLTRIGNRTLPGIMEAAWLPDGSRAFVRFLERSADGTDHTAAYALPADGAEGFPLEQNLASVGVTGSSTVFTLLPSGTGSVASIAAALGSGATTLFTTPMREITLQAAGTGYIATTKASSAIPGYGFSVTGSGAFTRILGPLTGLATLPSPDGKSVLYSYVVRGKLYTSVIDLTTRASTPLPLATLAEKCAWALGGRELYCGVPQALSGTLPDDWYQGAVAFSDRLWRIDLATRQATLLIDPGQAASVSIDMVAATIDDASDVVVFTNRNDGSLWAYDL